MEPLTLEEGDTPPPPMIQIPEPSDDPADVRGEDADATAAARARKLVPRSVSMIVRGREEDRLVNELDIIRRWLQLFLKKKIALGGVLDRVKGGAVFCRLANRIEPDAVMIESVPESLPRSPTEGSQKSVPSAMTKRANAYFMAQENWNRMLKWCGERRYVAADPFEPQDLISDRNVPKAVKYLVDVLRAFSDIDRSLPNFDDVCSSVDDVERREKGRENDRMEEVFAFAKKHIMKDQAKGTGGQQSPSAHLGLGGARFGSAVPVTDSGRLAGFERGRQAADKRDKAAQVEREKARIALEERRRKEAERETERMEAKRRKAEEEEAARIEAEKLRQIEQEAEKGRELPVDELDRDLAMLEDSAPRNVKSIEKADEERKRLEEDEKKRKQREAEEKRVQLEREKLMEKTRAQEEAKKREAAERKQALQKEEREREEAKRREFEAEEQKRRAAADLRRRTEAEAKMRKAEEERQRREAELEAKRDEEEREKKSRVELQMGPATQADIGTAGNSNWNARRVFKVVFVGCTVVSLFVLLFTAVLPEKLPYPS